MKGHLITQTRVRPRTSSLFHIGFTEQLAVRKAAAREQGRTASLKTWLSASGYTRDSAIFPSALGRLHQKLTPALSPHRHRDSYATGSPREAPITENFSNTNRKGSGLQRVNKIWPQPSKQGNQKLPLHSILW